MMTSSSSQQYCFELNEHDVLCGRGSGPNDRVGNIEFRNLVLSRKAEYLAAPSRDAKGRIASSIVDTVRARGGRFLKKLSPAQAKDAGFKRGVTVYETADESTVLEKAKQTLRQNRAEFVKEQTECGRAGGPTLAAAAAAAESAALSAPINVVPSTARAPISSENHNENSAASVQESLSPIPLSDASVGLDSMQRPNLSTRTTEHLNRTLFASSNISSITNPSVASTGLDNGVISNPDLRMGSSSGSVLSMNTAELCAVVGGSLNNMSQNSKMSGDSARAFGTLLREYNADKEKALIQQHEELKAQQQLMLQQQRALPEIFQPNSMHFISEEQQQMQGQQQVAQQPQNQDMNTSDVFASLLRQYNIPLISENQLAAQQQHDQPSAASVGMQQRHMQSNDDPNKVGAQATASNNNDTLSGLSPKPQSFLTNMQFIPEEQQQMHFKKQTQQLQKQHEVNPSEVFSSLLGQHNVPPTPNTTQQRQQQYEHQRAPPTAASKQQEHEQPQEELNDIASKTTRSNSDGSLSGSLLKRLSADDQQLLLQQFQQLHSQNMYNEYIAPPETDDQQKILQQFPQSQPLYNEAASPTEKSGPQVYQAYTAPLNVKVQQLQAQHRKMGFSSSRMDSQQMLHTGSYADTLGPLKDFHTHNVGSYTDTLLPLNDLQPSKRGQSKETDCQLKDPVPLSVNAYVPGERRPSRRRQRQTPSSGSRSTDTSLPISNTSSSLKSSQTTKSLMETSLRLSSVEPANYTEESMRLSFLTANRLAKTLEDMSTTSLGASGTLGLKQSATSRTSMKHSLDSSMLSLMSMSLSEFDKDVLPAKKEPSASNDNNSNNSSEESGLKLYADPPTPWRPLEVAVEKKDEDEEDGIRFGESVMSLGASSDEENWNKND